MPPLELGVGDIGQGTWIVRSDMELSWPGWALTMRTSLEVGVSLHLFPRFHNAYPDVGLRDSEVVL